MSVELIEYPTRAKMVEALREMREDPDESIVKVDVVDLGRTLRIVRRDDDAEGDVTREEVSRLDAPSGYVEEVETQLGTSSEPQGHDANGLVPPQPRSTDVTSDGEEVEEPSDEDRGKGTLIGSDPVEAEGDSDDEPSSEITEQPVPEAAAESGDSEGSQAAESDDSSSTDAEPTEDGGGAQGGAQRVDF